MYTLEPDLPPVHQFASGTVSRLAVAQTLFAEHPTAPDILKGHRIGNFPHLAGLLVDKSINTIANLCLAPEHLFIS